MSSREHSRKPAANSAGYSPVAAQDSRRNLYPQPPDSGNYLARNSGNQNGFGAYYYNNSTHGAPGLQVNYYAPYQPSPYQPSPYQQYPYPHHPYHGHGQYHSQTSTYGEYQEWYHQPRQQGIQFPNRGEQLRHNGNSRKKKHKERQHNQQHGSNKFAPKAFDLARVETDYPQTNSAPDYQDHLGPAKNSVEGSNERYMRNHNEKGRKRGKGNQWKIRGGGKKHKNDAEMFVDPKYIEAVTACGNSPEDIERWRAERKKRFPTRRRVVEELDKRKASDETAVASFNIRSRDGADSTQPHSNNSDEKGVMDRQLTANSDRLESGKRKRRLCRHFNKGKCFRGSACRYGHDEEARKAFMISQRKQAENKAFLEATGRSGGKASLLRMLLLGDIEKEKFVVLECLRCIRKENFFQS
uniref:C3H1-type domain-containing protein n=1 Tax=Aplanochytrium stocchinoi TaxID=215587 RepID=A0A6S8A8W3_9STRA|mmetsp:Transcript_27199/g.33121  ORF Transcript_27199/g.33121 Transcript_27199/m.33121 type:complete len:412 (-) Transcript_27199:522-1757(-)|eukprot:CAMPEP_0204824630 /NCGR_PEP_ID=MMETSP1346-20131115/2632_1 /ASSEMBLY_ACC=CAM_ASM_000771 /TAXON_ID=215587 /ORGANISM="Aplanochytrium stocchinoi, Strain GSBS06" /LENGTH=411 /DNA_ID=CAMNT_0051951885 /DNA_START=125 /DNA_END=1360 /DNA_ORIENTATION=+